MHTGVLLLSVALIRVDLMQQAHGAIKVSATLAH